MEWFPVRGCGPVGAFGLGMQALGRSVIKAASQQPDSTGNVTRIPARFCVESFDWLNARLSPHKLRRVDRFGRLALTALYLCLEDAGAVEEEWEDCGLVLASGYGPVASSCLFKDSFIDNGPSGASPTAFTKSVQNQAAAHIAMQLQLTGPVTTICQHWFPVQSALQTACLWLLEKKVPKVLVGMVDEWIPFFNYCVQQYQNCGVTIDAQSRNRLAEVHAIPAEGAVFLLLEQPVSEDSGLVIRMPQLSCQDVSFFNKEVSDKLIAQEMQETMNNFHGADSLNNSKNYRHIYGNFPTASALDLCSLTLQLTSGERGRFLEGNAQGYCYGVDLLRQTNSEFYAGL